MKKLFKIKSLNKKKKIGVLLLVILGLFFVSFDPANAAYSASDLGAIGSNALGTAVALVLGLIAYLITSVFGLITTILVKILVNVAQFNNIINVETVKIGWTTVRDICNMFFVLILLVIAFATILRYQNYSIKRLLPKLLIMAVLINFSRTIFGLIIDFAQVIMLTFASAFANGGGWFINMFNVQKLFTMETLKTNISTKDPLTSWATAISVIAGVLASLVILIVVLVILIVLVIRIVMLWIYTILSPLIFIGFAFPPLQKYTNRIWEDFIKQVIIGPILVFFIWLALTTAKTSSEMLAGAGNSVSKGNVCAGVGSSAFFCDKDLQRFIITIGLLAGGLMVAQQFGGAAGSIAGKGMGWAKGSAMKVSGAKWAGDRIKSFNASRQAEKSRKAEETGRKMFGLYSGAKGAAGGTVKGLRRTTAGRGPTVTDSFVGKYTGLQAIRTWKNNKQARKDERNRKIEALNTGVYKDEKGKEFKKGEKGFKSMSKTQAEFISGWRDSTRKSRGIVNQIEAEKINKEQQEMLDSGASTTELASVLESKSAPRDKKAAAAITLAIKEGFKSRDQVKRAKEGIGANAPLMKKFEDILHKRFAHLDFDLSVNGKGEFNNKTDVGKFHDRIDEGVVDGTNLHHSFYEKEGNIRALKDYYGVGFASKLDLAAGRTKKSREAVKTGLTEAKISDIRSGDKERALVNEKTGETNNFAKTLARINGDYVTAFNNSSDSGKIVFDESSQKAATKFFEAAKPAWLDNANTDNLRIDKVEKDYGVGKEDAKNIVKSMEQAVADGVNGSKLVNMSRGGYSPEFVSRSIGIMHDRYGNKGEKYEVEIKNNNILNNVKETKPDSENAN